MSVLCDKQIHQLATEQEMITPYQPNLVRDGISSGPSSYGYDARLDRQFKIFTNIHSTHIDPKNFDEKSFPVS